MLMNMCFDVKLHEIGFKLILEALAVIFDEILDTLIVLVAVAL